MKNSSNSFFPEGHGNAVKEKASFRDLTVLDASVMWKKTSNEMYAKLFSK